MLAAAGCAGARFTCQQGYVRREAFAGDDVCVEPWARDQAHAENIPANARIEPVRRRQTGISPDRPPPREAARRRPPSGRFLLPGGILAGQAGHGRRPRDAGHVGRVRSNDRGGEIPTAHRRRCIRPPFRT